MTDRPHLVLIPGLLCTAALYGPQVEGLADAAHVTVANHTTADSLPAIAATILAAAPKTFALCGLSMGGYLAFEILRQAPARVTKVALLDTSARADTPERTAARRQQVALVERQGIAVAVREQLPQWIHPRRMTDTALTETVARMAAETGVTHFARQQTAIGGRIDSRPGLAAITVPALVLVGREDAVTTVEHAQEIAGGIKGSTLAIVEDCGHLSTLEQPNAVTRALRQWLGVA
jgi:pimeloyl-ACP methyl ester carboxylesterase